MKPLLTKERFEQAITATADLFELPRRAIIERRRTKPIAAARLALYAALDRYTDAGCTGIAAYVNRDHTTILWGVDRAIERAAIDPEYAERIEAIGRATLAHRRTA